VNRDLIHRAFVACAMTALMTASAGCGGGRSTATPTASPSPVSWNADLAAFEAKPNDITYEALHADIVEHGLSDAAARRILNRLVVGHVPALAVNDAVADISSVDFVGALWYLRALNIGGQVNPTGTDIVRRTADLAWIILQFRAYGDKTVLNMTKMDLRSPNAFSARNMGLNDIDFSEAHFRGGNIGWHTRLSTMYLGQCDGHYAPVERPMGGTLVSARSLLLAAYFTEHVIRRFHGLETVKDAAQSSPSRSGKEKVPYPFQGGSNGFAPGSQLGMVNGTHYAVTTVGGRNGCAGVRYGKVFGLTLGLQ
jgi:hypothetical protein